MSAVWGHLAGVITVILMLCFVSIWVWAWLPQHRQAFDALAQLPMDDGPGVDGPTGNGPGGKILAGSGSSGSEPRGDEA